MVPAKASRRFASRSAHRLLINSCKRRCGHGKSLLALPLADVHRRCILARDFCRAAMLADVAVQGAPGFT